MREIKTLIGEQTANKENASAEKNDKKRSPIGATEEKILTFIMECELHECDAIKVAMDIVNSSTKANDINGDNANILNSYLNAGLEPSATITQEKVMTHRQAKAYHLAISVGKFVEKKEQIAQVSASLVLFASLSTHVNAAMQQLRVNTTNNIPNQQPSNH